MGFASEIYDDQNQTFKLNLSFGSILQHVETGDYRYFKAYSNYPLLDLPISISNRLDLEKVQDHLNELDLTAYISKDRPDTKWRLVLITNVRFYITSTGFPLGQGELPGYIKNSKSIISLTHSFKVKTNIKTTFVYSGA